LEEKIAPLLDETKQLGDSHLRIDDQKLAQLDEKVQQLVKDNAELLVS
jgi:hypothetical protein